MNETDNKLLHADLTYAIRAVLFHIGNHLWPGLPEVDFQRAASIGLTKRQIAHCLEKQFRVYYQGIEVGRYYCDVFVDRKVILELKVVSELTALHRAQIISYLRVTGADVGLLVNFGGPKVEIERSPLQQKSGPTGQLPRRTPGYTASAPPILAGHNFIQYIVDDLSFPTA